MSSSTILYRGPPKLGNVEKFGDGRDNSLLIFSLWMFACIFSVAKTEFTANITGISISFNIQDVLFMGFSCWLLHRGLSSRNFILVIPWMTMTIYSLYYNHYKGLMKMTQILKNSRNQQNLPWFALSIAILALLIRVMLTLKIVTLSANLWYRKKLEKDIININK